MNLLSTCTNVDNFVTNMELFRKFDAHRITIESTYSEILTRTGFVSNENDKTLDLNYSFLFDM